MLSILYAGSQDQLAIALASPVLVIRGRHMGFAIMQVPTVNNPKWLLRNSDVVVVDSNYVHCRWLDCQSLGKDWRLTSLLQAGLLKALFSKHLNFEGYVSTCDCQTMRGYQRFVS